MFDVTLRSSRSRPEGRQDRRYTTVPSVQKEEYCPSQVSSSAACLTASLNLGRDQANLIDTGGMRLVDYLGYIVKRNVWISLDEHHFFRASLEDVVQLAFKVIQRDVVLVDLVCRLISTASQHLHHDRTVARRRLLRLVFGRLGYQRVQTFRSQRGDHHKNDEQHQQHVNQRRNVNIG